MVDFLSKLQKSGALDIYQPLESLARTESVKSAKINREVRALDAGRKYLKIVTDADDYGGYLDHMEKMGLNKKLFPDKEAFRNPTTGEMDDELFNEWKENALVDTATMMKLKKGNPVQWYGTGKDGMPVTQTGTEEDMKRLYGDNHNFNPGRLIKETQPPKTKPKYEVYYDADGKAHRVDMNDPKDSARIEGTDWTETPPKDSGPKEKTLTAMQKIELPAKLQNKLDKKIEELEESDEEITEESFGALRDTAEEAGYEIKRITVEEPVKDKWLFFDKKGKYKYVLRKKGSETTNEKTEEKDDVIHRLGSPKRKNRGPFRDPGSGREFKSDGNKWIEL